MSSEIKTNNQGTESVRFFVASYYDVKPSDDVIIADIAGRIPDMFKNSAQLKLSFKSLTPDYKNLLEPYQKGLMKDDDFRMRYHRDVLEANRDKILASLEKIQLKSVETGKDVVLCSYEKDTGMSHRQAVMDFLSQNGYSCQKYAAHTQEEDIDAIMAPSRKKGSEQSAGSRESVSGRPQKPQASKDGLTFRVDIPDEWKKRIAAILSDKKHTELIRNVYGLNLVQYVQNTTKKASLEALAFNMWTPPIKCNPYYSNYEDKYLSFRFYSIKDDKGNTVVKDETYPIPVDIKKVVEDGKERIVYDRHALVENSDVKCQGKSLSPDQVKELMFNGTLSIVGKNANGEDEMFMIQCHPYNKKHCIHIPSKVVKQRLDKCREFRPNKDEKIMLTDTQITELSVGHVIPVGNDHFIRYDIMVGKLIEVDDPSKAKNQYYSERAEKAQEAELEKQHAQEQMMANRQGNNYGRG